jgi:hypothetical protein
MERKGPMPLQYPGLEAVCQTKATGQRLLLATKSWDRTPAAKRFLGLPAEDYTNLVKESANL